ncbi:MAG: hypothetical protein IKY33_00455 [Clostridia bacterium]|nr:hypothetical protein [Clostridia bacterium]
MKTDTTALKAAYAKKTKALKTLGSAADEELVAQEKELHRDTTAALQNAYVENIRASYRAGQANRAAGITGGQAIASDISRENQYGAARADIKLGRETGQQSIDNQRGINKANTAADVAANELAMESDLFGIEQTEQGHTRSTYATMLQSGYIPTGTDEAQKMADALGISLDSLRAYVARINSK